MKTVTIKRKCRQTDSILETEVRAYHTYGVWAVTMNHKFLHWTESRDPDKGPKPDDRWQITHIPSGFGVLGGMGCDMRNRERVRQVAKDLHQLTKDMEGLDATDHREVAQVEGLKTAVRTAALPLCW